MLCQVAEGNGLRIHPGTDGKDFEWKNSVLLNFRKTNLDSFIDEIKIWAHRGVSGIRLDSAQSWPLILKPDDSELLREDSDGEYHYTLDEIMSGDIVLPSSDEGFFFKKKEFLNTIEKI